VYAPVATPIAGQARCKAFARLLELDHRAEHLPEATIEYALVGMLAALFPAGRPAFEVANARDASKPLASTNSSGTV